MLRKITLGWDADAEVWTAVGEGVPELVLEAATLVELGRKIDLCVPILLRDNAHLLPNETP